MNFKTLMSVGLMLAISLGTTARDRPSLIPSNDTVSLTRGSKVLAFDIASGILKQTRKVYVVLPPSFESSSAERRYPVTIVLDGESNLPPVTAINAELSLNGQIPESLIVAIPNIDPLRGRVHDLTPPGMSVSGSGVNEGGDQFLDFIEQELLPAVDLKFRGGLPRVFIGHSSGGVLATYVAATRQTYRAVVALDAPIHLDDNWLAKKLIERARKPAIPIRYVSMEARFGWPEDAWKSLVAAAPPSWKLYRERLWPRESHESIGMYGMYVGLREAFSDYAVLAAPTAPTTSILPYYKKVGDSLGATVIPPRKLLRNVVEDLLMEGRGAAAHDAFNTLVSGYGAPVDSSKLMAEITETERQPPPSETVEGLLATPLATPDEVKDYIGEWLGDTWMNPSLPRKGNIKLRISVENGRVVGETIHLDAPPEARVMRWQYLKKTPEGITWGFMNGMRPRALILFEGNLRGDVLAGTSRFGGINFKGPGGSSGAAISFSFKRVR